jgi:gamma-glutamyltranspeptidase / glutathione hydrolase
MRAPFVTTWAANGMVCSVDHLASSAGVAMLRRGGSAADAAVAASAVLAVTTQHMCGMGGDLFALVATDGTPRPDCLVAAGRAGAGADAAALRADGHLEVPATGDIRAVTVPGCVDGWLALHARHGRLDLAEVLAPAIEGAAHGFPASVTLAAAVQTVSDLPGAGDYRGPVTPGTIIRRPGVARALAGIAERGRDAFYCGEFGDGLLQLGRGWFAESDLERSGSEWVEPLGLDVFGGSVWSPPPPSQGYLALLAAAVAQHAGVPEDPTDPAWAHALVEASRAAGHDRDDVLSDGADVRPLLTEAEVARRAALLDGHRASTLPAPHGGGDTIFLTAVDRQRMGVSLIQSNAAGWGARIFEPSTGISLHNRGIGFSLAPGHPAELAPG